MSSNTENNRNFLNKLKLTPEQINKYRKAFKSARTQQERNNVRRNANEASKRNVNRLINKVERLNVRENKKHMQAAAKIADKGASIVARLIEQSYVNDAMIVLVFGLTTLVGSDRLVGNYVRMLPGMRPRTSARGPVNYFFKRTLFELQKFFADVHTPYLSLREEILATYGPERASFFGKSLDIAMMAMTFMYVAVRVGRLSPKLVEVFGPSLSKIYERVENKKMAAQVVAIVLNFCWQLAQESTSFNTKSIAGALKLLKNIRGRRTQKQTDNAIQTILSLVQGAPVGGRQATQVLDYVQQQPYTVQSPGGTQIPVSPSTPPRRRAVANRQNAFATPPRRTNVQNVNSPRGRPAATMENLAQQAAANLARRRS